MLPTTSNFTERLDTWQTAISYVALFSAKMEFEEETYACAAVIVGAVLLEDEEKQEVV